MDDDFHLFRPAYMKIVEDMECLNRVLTPSYLSVYEQMERVLEPIRRQHLEISRAVELSGRTSSHLAEIVMANQRWQDLIDQATVSGRVFEDIRRTHQTWLDTISPLQDSISQLQAAARLSLGDLAYRATVAEQLFAGIDFDAMRQAKAIPEQAFLKFQEVIGNVTSTYEKLATSIQIIPDLTFLPTFALRGATREVFMTGFAADTICIREEPKTEREPSEAQLIAEVEQETSGCFALLQALDPSLAKPYIGAHDALQGKNADRARHILSSLREFWNHLLRRLAPDEQVLSWVSTGDKDLLHEGRPTRRARVLYVCRSLNHGPLTDFVVQDTRALVNLVEFFNRVHELDPGLTDEQLHALLLRTDSWLTYILQISKGTR